MNSNNEIISSQDSVSENWRATISLDDLPVGERYLFRFNKRKIAIFRTTADEVFAIDDQCPHEGYPLIQGKECDLVLTCSWHNFKFDLKTGNCLKGDEDVRSYHVRIRDNTIELDVADPPVDQQISQAIASLREGLRERRSGQVAREVVRLLQLEMPAADIAFLAAKYDAEFAEYGTTHVLPVVADMISLLDRFPGTSAALPLMQGMDLAGDFHVRRPARPTVEPVMPIGDPRMIFEDLHRLVEEERAQEAEAVLRGAIESGLPRSLIEPWFFRLCSDHFLGFGHALIYTVKAFDLLEHVGWHHANDILPALVVGIVNQTREELVPEWKWFCKRLSAVEEEFAELYVLAASDDSSSITAQELVMPILDGKREQAFDAVISALQAGTSLAVIVDALSQAAAERILRFDTSIDATDDVQEGWLDVTHLLTFANAVRHATRRFRTHDVIKFLLFGARFINNAKSLDLPIERRLEIALESDTSVDLSDIVGEIRSGHVQSAITHCFAYCTSNDRIANLRTLCEDLAMEDRATRPIVVGHLIKTCRVAFEEQHATNSLLPVFACIALVTSPVRQRWVSRETHEAIQFLEHGSVPKTLT